MIAIDHVERIVSYMETVLELIELYADTDGETHFRFTDIDLDLCDFAPPSEPIQVSEAIASTSSVFLVAPPGWDKDFHPTPRRQLAVMLSGSASIQASDGQVMGVAPGSIVLLNDQNSKGHLTQVQGDHDAKFLLIGLAETP